MLAKSPPPCLPLRRSSTLASRLAPKRIGGLTVNPLGPVVRDTLGSRETAYPGLRNPASPPPMRLRTGWPSTRPPRLTAIPCSGHTAYASPQRAEETSGTAQQDIPP